MITCIVLLDGMKLGTLSDFVLLCPMKSYRESLYVTLSHGTQNDSKTFKITKWDKVRQSGTCFKNNFKNKKKHFNKEKTTKNNFQLNIY